MYFRLAFKNVKRSIKDYLIYIMTLTACISLFYILCSCIVGINLNIIHHSLI